MTSTTLDTHPNSPWWCWSGQRTVTTFYSHEAEGLEYKSLIDYFMINFLMNSIYDWTLSSILIIPTPLCSHCYGSSRSSCSSCIDRWRPWRCPCYAAVAAAGSAAGWGSTAPCRARSRLQPPPLSLCLRRPWACPRRRAAANHASPLVSQTSSCSIMTCMCIHVLCDDSNPGAPVAYGLGYW